MTQRKSKARQFLERGLLLAGLTATGIWAWAVIRSAVSQDWDNWVFERQRSEESTTISDYLHQKQRRLTNAIAGRLENSSPAEPQRSGSQSKRKGSPPPSEGDVIGRLVIPDVHVSAMVREGSEERTLGLALGHIPGTALPGEKGNVGIAGHRDTLFRGLRKIAKNHLIRMQTLAGSYVYQVETLSIVKPEDVSVLKPGKYDGLTLVTCYPFDYIGAAPDRFIVKARLLPDGPSSDEIAKPQVAQLRQSRNSVRPDTPHRAFSRKVGFQVQLDHSRLVVPGVSVGLSTTDTTRQRASGWMWIMRDHRTILLRDQPAFRPIVYYSRLDGRRRELVVTKVSRKSVSGYLLVYGNSSDKPAAR